MRRYHHTVIGVATFLIAMPGALPFLDWTASATPATPAETSPAKWQVPDIDQLPDDSWGKTVRLGRDLVTKTDALIGPNASDPAKRYAGSALACQNCHLSAGTVAYGLPLVGVFEDYPQYSARDAKVQTLQDRINGCMTRSMNGRPLPDGSDEMTALVSYMKFLSTGRPVGDVTPQGGSGIMPELSRAADPNAGAKIFANNCAACHGANGQGQPSGSGKGYQFPPLWGDGSFNDGAGMATLIDAANFIHSNMPLGATNAQPVLTVEQAWDVAAYIVSRPRPIKSGLGEGYPILTEKPVDVPYGPYADGFSSGQHKFGPFAPIRAKLEAIEKAHPAASAADR